MTKSSSQSSYEDICKEIQLTQKECQKVREKYLEMYGEDLFDLLQNNIDSSKTFLPLSTLLLNPHERDAFMAKDAIFKQRDRVNYKALIEIYGGRKPSHFFLIQQAYQSKFRRPLDQDIINIEPHHSYQKILMALAASQKGHIEDVSLHISKCDAQGLFHNGEARSGVFKINEDFVLEILSKRSIPQLKLTFSMFKNIYGHSYSKFLKNKNIDDNEFEDAWKTVVKFINDPPKYYAKALEAGLKGRTKDEGEVERILVSRAKIDMYEIRKIYKKKYGMELRDAIFESISPGDYRDLLLAFTMKTCIDL